MEKEDTIRIRDKFRTIKDKNGNPGSLKIFGDNMALVADESRDFVVWDDASATLYVIKPNENYGLEGRAQFWILGTPYSYIEFIISYATAEKFKTFAKNELSMTDIQIDNAVRHIAPAQSEFVANLSKKNYKDPDSVIG